LAHKLLASLPPALRTRRALWLGLAGAVVLAGMAVPLLVTGSKPPVANVPAPEAPALPDLGPMLGRLVVGTVAVLALSVGVLWFVGKKLRPAPGQKSGSQIEVIGAVRVDPRCQVYLVRARGQRLLAGVDATGIRAVVPVPTSGVHSLA
jgi:flagellar biogenesis protein FliO